MNISNVNDSSSDICSSDIETERPLSQAFAKEGVNQISINMACNKEKTINNKA